VPNSSTRSSKRCSKSNAIKRCFTRTKLCLVERVISASADPGRNTSLHDARTFSGVRRSNAACTFSYINVPSRFSLLRAARIVRMPILRSCRRDVLCHDANVAMRRIRVLSTRARARCHTRQPRLCVVCVLTNELAGKFAKTYIYLITTISLLGTFAWERRRRIGFRNSRKRYLNFQVPDVPLEGDLVRAANEKYLCVYMCENFLKKNTSLIKEERELTWELTGKREREVASL